MTYTKRDTTRIQLRDQVRRLKKEIQALAGEPDYCVGCCHITGLGRCCGMPDVKVPPDIEKLLAEEY